MDALHDDDAGDCSGGVFVAVLIAVPLYAAVITVGWWLWELVRRLL